MYPNEFLNITTTTTKRLEWAMTIDPVRSKEIGLKLMGKWAPTLQILLGFFQVYRSTGAKLLFKLRLILKAVQNNMVPWVALGWYTIVPLVLGFMLFVIDRKHSGKAELCHSLYEPKVFRACEFWRIVWSHCMNLQSSLYLNADGWCHLIVWTYSLLCIWMLTDCVVSL